MKFLGKLFGHIALFLAVFALIFQVFKVTYNFWTLLMAVLLSQVLMAWIDYLIRKKNKK